VLAARILRPMADAAHAGGDPKAETASKQLHAANRSLWMVSPRGRGYWACCEVSITSPRCVCSFEGTPLEPSVATERDTRDRFRGAGFCLTVMQWLSLTKQGWLGTYIERPIPPNQIGGIDDCAPLTVFSHNFGPEYGRASLDI